mmetsp:Transcript_4033/g.8212  ORF Transcript_4033/g.8212 Transcript_4033/m.8212 type:complete len:209 (-) Transcript_4033:317-943(-)
MGERRERRLAAEEEEEAGVGGPSTITTGGTTTPETCPSMSEISPTRRVGKISRITCALPETLTRPTFSRETTAAPKAAELSSTKNPKKPRAPSANFKTLSSMDVPSSFAKTASKADTDTDTTTTTTTEATTTTIATPASCTVNPPRRDASSSWEIYPGRPVGGSSRTISVSVETSIARRSPREAMEGRGDLVWSGSTVRRMRRPPFRS